MGAVFGFGGAIALMYTTKSDVIESDYLYIRLLITTAASYAISALIVKKKLTKLKSTELSISIYSIWQLLSLVILVAFGFFTNIDYT